MPAKLTKHSDEVVRVKLSGTKPEFQDLLAKTKSIAGRRWNPDEKVWELPCEAEVIQKAVNILQPELDAALQALVREARGAVADDLRLTIHAHPTMSEALMEASAVALGEAIHVINR